jgi:lysophospholipase L1-like esterase
MPSSSIVTRATARFLQSPTTIGRGLTVLVVALTLVVFSYGGIRPSSKPAATLRIIAVGDSLTAGYYRISPRDAPFRKIGFRPYSIALQAALGPKAAVFPFGLPGFTSQQLLDVARSKKLLRMSGAPVAAPRIPGIVPAIVKHSPQIAIIMAGTNDIFKSGDHDGTAIASRVWKLHTVAHDANVKTVALAVPGWGPRREAPTARVGELRLAARSTCNAELKRLANASDALATYLDFPFAFTEQNSAELYAGLIVINLGKHRFRLWSLALSNLTTPDMLLTCSALFSSFRCDLCVLVRN